MDPQKNITPGIKRALLACVVLLLPLQPIIAQPTFSGFLQLDKRFITGKDSVYIDNFYNRFRLEMSAPVGSRLYLFSSLDLRFYDLPNPTALNDLERLESTFPHELSVWEAFIDVYGFLFDDLDIRVGKQRIAWGRADKLNPTDNLNPNDLSDLVHFTDRAPSWAFKGTWYIGRNRLTGVWLPGITPVLLPREGAGLFLDNAAAFNDELKLPDQTPENSMFAFRWDGNVDKWDYSISYFNGYDDIPVATRLTANPPLPSRIELEFPKFHVIGTDLVTELSGIGLWAEAGLFIPEKVELVSQVNGATGRDITLDDEPYFRYTIGGDYTFSNGLYLNAQWSHGLFTERGAGELHDYVVLRIEQEYFNDGLLLGISGILELNGVGQQGYGLMPELNYQAIDNFEAGLGGFLIWGDEGTLFHGWEELDQVFVRFRMDF